MNLRKACIEEPIFLNYIMCQSEKLLYVFINIHIIIFVCVCFWKQPHSDMSDGTELMVSFDSTDFLIGLGKFSELFQMRCQEHV